MEGTRKKYSPRGIIVRSGYRKVAQNAGPPMNQPGAFGPMTEAEAHALASKLRLQQVGPNQWECRDRDGLHRAIGWVEYIFEKLGDRQDFVREVEVNRM